MSDFYVDTLCKLLARGVLRRDMSILVVCGGRYDKESLAACGFQNVVISNLDTRSDAGEYAPYQWSFQDAESLDYEDGRFDFSIAHSGLHHCRSPHRGLLEMYRVARVGLLVFEPADNFTTRLGARLGLGQQYELAAVAGNEYRFGGMRNTPIPNYVYRWTRREVEKTILAYAPVGKHRFRYFHKLRMPWYRSQMMSRRWLDAVYLAALPALWLFTLAFPRECNNFAFVVLKPDLPGDLHPWLQRENGQVRLDRPWLARRYGRVPSPEAANVPAKATS